MLNELRDLDFNDIGSAPASVRYIILGFLLAIILVIGYFLLVKAKTEQLELVQQLEGQLRVDFEAKQAKAANLEAYEAQLARAVAQTYYESRDALGFPMLEGSDADG